ncbi:protein translocase subunit SecD [Salinarimonas soli]|uniref:Multifunctional fusion protein n=1 Tax=Salinarimonas soli TaxID=1638099 RepID=A0A5B2W236_9HYPH|nr:protein translocase subunit SecD [Salinarimonas soli]KAA2244299.1 protein translocase subunit SecD [Salinarimonas soli]
MLVFSRLKAALILCACLVGIVLSLPNVIRPESLPAWMPHRHVNLGLDLQGGSYLLLEADMTSVVRDKLVSTRAAMAQTLNKAGLRPTELAVRAGAISLLMGNDADLERARAALAETLGGRTEGRSPLPVFDQAVAGSRLTVKLSEAALTEMNAKAVTQSIAIVRRRIDETGVNEPVVARQGQNRILVELPGVSDPGRVKRLLGSTAKMTFRLVAPANDPDSDLLPLAEKGREGRIPVRRQVEVDGANLTDASAATDQRTGQWIVNFALDSIGTRRFAEVSTKHQGEPFAIVLDGRVISAPVIREPIVGGRGQISGSFTVSDANDLAVLLRAGALPAPLHVVEERSIGPSLGADAIRAGLLSVVAGFSLVVGFMVATYGRFGLFAAVALLMNLALTMAGLSLLGATLTLPGIAGILLALGMAVDANILVNERIREETKRGRGVVSAIETGFRRAYATIVDANATTLIKMLILFAVGTGAIKGFAVTISLGILISMFTAVLLVRLLTSVWLKRTRPKTLTIGTRLRVFPEVTKIPFMRARYSGLVVSAVISLASIALTYYPGLKMGVDFSGGVVVEARTQEAADFGALRGALGGLGLGPVQVQGFGSDREVLLRFEQQPEGTQSQAVERVRETLGQVAPGAEIRRVEVVGATVGSELFQEGLLALGLAAVAMFGYIAIRFEWPFAVGAIVTMFLDLTKTLGFFALTGMEFNLASIAAILTIMGFSINDKVVVYDRVRENLRLYKSKPLAALIDLSINETLSRTVGTSLALFLAIAPLALFGGAALHEFAVVLLFGLVLATSSSIFIAAPILLNLGERRLRRGDPTPAPDAATAARA